MEFVTCLGEFGFCFGRCNETFYILSLKSITHKLLLTKMTILIELSSKMDETVGIFYFIYAQINYI